MYVSACMTTCNLQMIEFSLHAFSMVTCAHPGWGRVYHNSFLQIPFPQRVLSDANRKCNIAEEMEANHGEQVIHESYDTDRTNNNESMRQNTWNATQELRWRLM